MRNYFTPQISGIKGWGVSFGLTTADAFWGEDFYNWVDKKNKKK